MGPNGTGKSTLSSAIMGHPKYEVTEGSIIIDGEDVLEMEVDERAQAGLFLAMQYPSEISGVTNADFLRSAINARREEGDEISLMKFIRTLDKTWNSRNGSRNGTTLLKRRFLWWRENVTKSFN